MNPLPSLTPEKKKMLAQLNRRALEKINDRARQPITEDVEAVGKMIATVVNNQVIIVSEAALKYSRAK
jgi:hypothetical protein